MTSSYIVLLLFQVQIHSAIIFINLTLHILTVTLALTLTPSLTVILTVIYQNLPNERNVCACQFVNTQQLWSSRVRCSSLHQSNAAPWLAAVRLMTYLHTRPPCIQSPRVIKRNRKHVNSSVYFLSMVKVVMWSRGRGGAHLTKPGWSKPHTHSTPN